MPIAKTIQFKLLPDGGFVAGDVDTGRTSYAYPTSTHATLAKRNPEREARIMLKAANRLQDVDTSEYDARNWASMQLVFWCSVDKGIVPCDRRPCECAEMIGGAA